MSSSTPSEKPGLAGRLSFIERNARERPGGAQQRHVPRADRAVRAARVAVARAPGNRTPERRQRGGGPGHPRRGSGRGGRHRRGVPGGSIGEVSGAKIAGALEQTLRDHQKQVPTCPVLLLESGGVRLQEANLGLMAIAEINAAIVALRSHVPVVGVIAGMVGCFGGMAMAAGLCSTLIMTREARLGLNGPEVIEHQAGVEEFDASDRPLVWSIDGGQARFAAGFADMLVGDNVGTIAATVREAFRQGVVAPCRSEQVERYRARLAAIDPVAALDATAACDWGQEGEGGAP